MRLNVEATSDVENYEEASNSDEEGTSILLNKPLVPYEGPIFEANRYLKRVTVTFRGLLR